MVYVFPRTEELQRIGEELGMTLSAEEAEQYRAFLDGMTPAFKLVEQTPFPTERIKYPRTPGYRPEPHENRYNAWYYKSSVKGAQSGKLKGKTVAVKDSVCVAGIPVTNGASILEGYVPEIDAAIVTRMLDAGAEIVGKSVCEYLCFAGNSITASTGPVENPRAPGHTTGGSSNGSAALLAAGEVDLAIGADQGGSIRMPAAFCGVVGLKPTYGLVPYTGCLSIEFSVDHVGPMARNVGDCALLLEVIAGDDGIDSRQRGVEPQPYRDAIGKGVKGMRIGVVKEGFGRVESEAGVDEAVRSAVRDLASAGATVDEISIPWHLYGPAIWLPIGCEGSYVNMMYGNGLGYGWNGAYSLSFINAFEGWESHANELAPTIKAVLLSGHVLRRHKGRIYAKAQNLRRTLRAKYDEALARYDVLVMPTTPMTALKIPPADATLIEQLHASWSMLNNTCPFDITGHPSISVPCGEFDNKPVGLMVTGRHFDELSVFRVADAVRPTQ
jgi:amidase